MAAHPDSPDAPVRLARRTVPGPPGTRAAPVVLLHGGGGDGSTWDPLVGPLARRADVVVPDLRGAGRSPAVGAASVTALRDDVLLLLDDLALNRVVLVGHSLGALLGLLVAVHDPGRVAALVLEECPPLEPLGLPVPDASDDASFYERRIRPAVLAALNAPERAWVDGLAGVRAPALVVGGGPESFLPQDAMARMAARLPDARFVTLPGGHLVHPTHPDAFLREVEAFLDLAQEGPGGGA
ncbi:alpha/beta fold hydrolase [Isoptericola sp. NPDC019571]|uniref:alpha/beta fold hydrolase n=1 Tax=Isoptericola sp. NPDC019571 TaxID=3364008 RepID=UPI0037A79E9B